MQPGEQVPRITPSTRAVPAHDERCVLFSDPRALLNTARATVGCFACLLVGREPAHLAEDVGRCCVRHMFVFVAVVFVRLVNNIVPPTAVRHGGAPQDRTARVNFRVSVLYFFSVNAKVKLKTKEERFSRYRHDVAPCDPREHAAHQQPTQSSAVCAHAQPNHITHIGHSGVSRDNRDTDRHLQARSSHGSPPQRLSESVHQEPTPQVTTSSKSLPIRVD